MRFIFLTIFWLIILTIIAQLLIFSWRVVAGKTMAKNTTPFSHSPANPSQRILVLGDSTAYGTGAEKPEVSTAGYFHQDFPNAEIVNISKNGAKIADLQEMIKQATGDFDLVLIQGGANDIIYFTSLEETSKNMVELLDQAKQLSDNVVLLTSGDIGAAPIFMPPINIIYTKRSKTFLAEFEKIAQEKDVARVDLYLGKKDDIFAQNSGKYYAKDQLHLSGTGYKSWYDKIRKRMEEAGIKL